MGRKWTNYSIIKNSTERRAWKAFENIQEIIQSVTCHCNFIFCIFIWFFYEYIGAVSNEHAERFHQDISKLGKRNSGMSSQNMLADFC
jgi:hypothetical protein